MTKRKHRPTRKERAKATKETTPATPASEGVLSGTDGNANTAELSGLSSLAPGESAPNAVTGSPSPAAGNTDGLDPADTAAAVAAAMPETPAPGIESPAAPAEGVPADSPFPEPAAPRKRGRPRGSRNRVGGAPGDAPEAPFIAGAPAAGTPGAGGVMSGPALSADPAKRLVQLERENAKLRENVADLRVRLDPAVHQMVKNSIAGLFMVVGKFAGRRYGDHMIVRQDEAQDAGEHCGNALIPLLGDMSKYVPFVVAVGSVAAIAIPRMEYEEQIRAGKAVRTFNGAPMVPPVSDVPAPGAP